MKARFGFTVPLCLLFAGLTFISAQRTHAQDQSSNITPPPNVLEVVVEYVKPGLVASQHNQTESIFVQAMRNAKWPTHYLGMNALAGQSRAVFFVPYDSFADWEKDNLATAKDPTLSAALDSASIADGKLLSMVQTSVFHFRPDLSLRPGADIGHTRYFDVSVFHIHPGHMADFEQLIKLYMAAYQNNPNVHWDAFEQMYGVDSGDTILVVTPRKSMDEIDVQMKDDSQLDSTLTPDQRKQMRDLTAASILSSWSTLDAINPVMSYPTDTWAQEDPAFWNQH
ncbi:MAG TPA: hypothetical protein VME86_05360 [Acidobacteriaceae bacterium]|nr:hypothetical protein [Acidobacteriaceae bacterium]